MRFDLSVIEIAIGDLFPGRVSATELNAAAQQAAIQVAMRAAQQIAQQEAQQAAAQQTAVQQAIQQVSSDNGQNLSKESVSIVNGDQNIEGETVPLYFSDLKDGVFKLNAEVVENYETTAQEVREALEQAIANPLEGIPTEDVIAAKKYLDDKRLSDFMKSVNSAQNNVTKLDLLKQSADIIIDRTSSLREIRFLSENLDDYLRYTTDKTIFDISLDDYLKTFNDLPENQVREILSDWEPKSVQFSYTNIDKLKVLSRSDASFKNKAGQIWKIFTEKRATSTIKTGIQKISVLEGLGLALNVADVGLNIYDSREELAASFVIDDEKATFIEKCMYFLNWGNNFNEINPDKHDKVWTSSINLLYAAGGTIICCLASPGIAGGLAITGAFMLGAAICKTAYYKKQYGDIDRWETFKQNIFGNDYTPKKSAALKSDLRLLADANVTTVIGGNANDTLVNNNRNSVTISGGSNNDFIFNQSSENVTISGGKGNDSITNVDSSIVTINGDGGSDLISKRASKVEICGGDGNNTVDNIGSGVERQAAAQT